MLAWLAQIGIGAIVGKIADAYAAKQNAATDQERIAADERIKALEAQRDVLVAEAGSRINAIIRAVFAVPVAIYLGKLILWDKVLGLGSTDDLSANLWDYAYIVVGFYFLHSMVTGRK